MPRGELSNTTSTLTWSSASPFFLLVIPSEKSWDFPAVWYWWTRTISNNLPSCIVSYQNGEDHRWVWWIYIPNSHKCQHKLAPVWQFSHRNPYIQPSATSIKLLHASLSLPFHLFLAYFFFLMLFLPLISTIGRKHTLRSRIFCFNASLELDGQEG